jgi:periplasmic protein TonB
MSPLDATTTEGSAPAFAALGGTVVAHGALAFLALLLGTRPPAARHETVPATELFDVELPRAPSPPPPAPPPEPPPPVPRAPATPPPRVPVATTPPAAALAGQVLTATPDAVDADHSLVLGAGDSYAGGATDAQGTSRTAVTTDQARGRAPQAPLVVVPTVDLSRPPRLAGGASWECPFPIEADDAGVDHAVVTLRVEVGTDGRATRVDIVKDPGSGFAREARRCATSKRWQAGLDRLGHAAITQATVNVRFDR